MLLKIKIKLERTIRLHSSFVLLITYLTISGMVTVVWFGHGQFLIYTDTHFPLLNLQKFTERMFNVLDTAYFPHNSNLRHLFLYPYASYFTPFIGLWNLSVASSMQHLFLFLTLFFGFTSIHFFLYEINRIGKQRIQPLAVLITGLIYVFNVYSALAIWRPFMSPAMLHYAFFPLFLAVSIHYLTTTGERKKHLVMLLLLSWIIFPAYNTIPLIFFDGIFLAAMLILIKKLYRINWSRLAADLVRILSGLIVLSIPLFLVMFSGTSLLSNQYKQLSSFPVDLSILLPFNSPSLEKAFFFSGYPPFYQIGGFDHFRNNIISLEPLLLVFTGGLIFIGILTIIKNKAKYLIVFPVLWLLFLFFITGSNNPFSNLKMFIFENILKEAFRSIYVRFGEPLLLASIPLIYFGIVKLSSVKRVKVNKIIGLFLLSLFLLSSFPILQGSFLEKQSSKTPSDRVNYPGPYANLLRLNDIEVGNFLYLTIPPSATINIRSWSNGTEGYIGPDVFPSILKGQTVLEKKIFENIMALVIDGRLDQVRTFLPLHYIIITFDQISEADKVVSNRYYTLLKKLFSSWLIYDDPKHFAIFELPKNSKHQTEDKEVFILGQGNADTEAAKEMFVDSTHTVIYRNLPIEAEYNLTYHIAEIIDFNKLNKLKVLSEVHLKPFREGNVFFPLFLEFPNANERVFVAVTRESGAAKWNLATGFWSADKMKWTYFPLQLLHSEKLTLLADFSKSQLLIGDNSTVTKVSMPEEWTKIIQSNMTRSRIITRENESNYGSIGVYVTSNFPSTAYLDRLQIKEADHSVINFKTPQASIRNLSQIAPSQFRLHVNASEPFIIALADSYDSSWVASVNGSKKTSSVPVHGINAFPINQTGQLEIAISYDPQMWYYLGTTVAETIYLLYLGCLSYVWIKKDGRKWVHYSSHKK